MKETVKKGLITTLTLGAIVLGAGAIIGVTSAFTSPFVYAHSLAARLEAVKGVFPDADDVSEPEEINSNGLVERYTVKKSNEVVGWAYSANMKSQSDTVDLMIGINADFTLGRVEVTSASSNTGFMDNAKHWLDEVNSGDRDYSETIPDNYLQGSGTRTARTMQQLIEAAMANAKANSGDTTVSEELKFARYVFPDATEVDAGTDLTLTSEGSAPQWKLTKRYEVKANGELLGYAYEGSISPITQVSTFALGIKPDGTFGRIYATSMIMNDHDGMYNPSWIPGTYIPEINSGDRDPSETAGGGATQTATYIYGMIKAAQNDVIALGGGTVDTPDDQTDAGLETAKLIYSDAAKTETDIPDGIVGVTSCYKVYDASDAVIGYVYNATYELPVTETLAETSSTSEPDVETGGSDVETGGTETVPEDPYKLSLAIGINPDGTFEKAVITNVSSLFSRLVDELYIAHINETKAPEENYIPEGMMASEAVQIAARNLNTMIYDIQEDVKPGYHDSLTGETPSTSEAGE